MKVCSRCAVPKELSDFHKHKGRKSGVTELCKNCRNIHIVSKRHGLSFEQLEELLSTNDRCTICNKHRSEEIKGLALDHDHKTGKFRGLLCGNCNNGIGRFKDSIYLLERAAKYLKGELNVK